MLRLDAAGWRDIAGRIRLRHPLLGMRFRVLGRGPWNPNISLETTLDIQHIPTGRDDTLIGSHDLPDECESERAAARFIRDCMLSDLAHELDEQFELDGVRIFDPHDREKRIA
jgi:hypothetical protein